MSLTSIACLLCLFLYIVYWVLKDNWTQYTIGLKENEEYMAMIRAEEELRRQEIERKFLEEMAKIGK